MQQPNIIFIMSDDHSANAISCYGSKVNQTPNIDRIANAGMRFDNCYCTNSICTPSRAVILSGMHSHKNGVFTLADAMPRDKMHLPVLLQQHGYQTAMIGKWHLCGGKVENHIGDGIGTPNGFDFHDILCGQGEYFDPIMIKNGVATQETGYVTDVITDKTLDYLASADKTKPFCLFCHHKAPHDPWTYDEAHALLYQEDMPIPKTFYDDYATRADGIKTCTQKIGQRQTSYEAETEGLTGNAKKEAQYQEYLKRYCRCIASIDDSVGRVLDYLQENSLAENTIVIYTSDQGFFIGEHGLFDKRFMYEESIQMPFVIQYPQKIAAGSVSDALVQNVDFAPTLLALAGIDALDEMDGVDFSPCFDAGKDYQGKDAIYYRYFMHLAHFGVPAHLGVRTRTHKLIYYYGKALGHKNCIDQDTPPAWELFDLVNDPDELHNLYDDANYATEQAALTQTLAQLMQAYGDTMPE